MLDNRLTLFAQRLTAKFNSIKTLITGGAPGLTGLQTTYKDDLVGAINEVLQSAAGNTDLSIGLNNANELQIVSSTGNNITLETATATLAGLLSAADKGKLNSVANGATQNDTDANLRDRSTHTGTQTAATISDFNSTVNALLVAIIDDAATANGTTWSSTKIDSEITTRIAAALEGEDLSDLAQAIQDLALADQGLVNANAAQSFSAVQQQQALDNINAVNRTDIGDTDIDLVAIFETGLL